MGRFQSYWKKFKKRAGIILTLFCTYFEMLSSNNFYIYHLLTSDTTFYALHVDVTPMLLSLIGYEISILKIEFFNFKAVYFSQFNILIMQTLLLPLHYSSIFTTQKEDVWRNTLHAWWTINWKNRRFKEQNKTKFEINFAHQPWKTAFTIFHFTFIIGQLTSSIGGIISNRYGGAIILGAAMLSYAFIHLKLDSLCHISFVLFIIVRFIEAMLHVRTIHLALILSFFQCIS